MPYEVAGRVLSPHQLIQDVNVADGEALILEWKIALEVDAELPYAYNPKPNAKKRGLYRESRLPEELQGITDEEELMKLPLERLFDDDN